MKAGLALAASLVLLATSCWAGTPQPVCFQNQKERISSRTLTVVEQRVLADAKVRSADECNKPEIQCVYDVHISKEHKIEVWLSYAVVWGTPAVCLYGPGSGAIYFYTIDGKYLDYSHAI